MSLKQGRSILGFDDLHGGDPVHMQQVAAAFSMCPYPMGLRYQRSAQLLGGSTDLSVRFQTEVAAPLQAKE